MKLNYYIVAFLIMIVTLSCSDTNTPNELPLSKTEILNVSYGTDNEQKYDIYLPEGRNSTTTKVILLVHGGGWVEGDKNDMNAYATYLQENLPNYAIVNINYRLASIGNPPFPMQLNDIKSVIGQLTQKKEEYQVSNNYGFIGISAGAHLSLLYTYAHDPNKNVKMVCSIVGPTNFTDPAYTNATEPGYMALFNSIQQIMGISYQDNIEYYKNVSPYHQVNSTSPPTLLFYGGNDSLIPISQGVEMMNIVMKLS